MSTHFQIKPIGTHWETYDPFIFCAFHHDYFPKGEQNLGPHPSLLFGRNIGQDFSGMRGWSMYHGEQIPGFPAHPHKGFETVTIAERGLVDHSDSIGALGRFGNGDVQWMTAGKGVQHSEMFPLLNQEDANELLLFQIWLNLPAKGKKADPYFSMFWHEDIPVERLVDDSGHVTSIKIITGNYGKLNALTAPPDSYANNPENSIAIWMISMEPHARFKIPATENGVNRAIYAWEGGNFWLNETQVATMHQARMQPGEEVLLSNGEKASKFLFLQGKPIGEPVVQYGPFVMNSREEIQQAFEEYQKTGFGGWPWPSSGNVHAAQKGRFAIHANGKVEERF